MPFLTQSKAYRKQDAVDTATLSAYESEFRAPDRKPDAKRAWRRRILACAILLAFALIPPLALDLSPPSPQTRTIHIEAFRYGFSPSRILVNRGDRLRLTFSTRDTGQSFFLQDYDLQVTITPGSKVVEVYRLSRPENPPRLEQTVEIIAGLPDWRGRLVSKSQFRNHVYNGPLHGTERGDLVVNPNYLLAGGLGLLCALPMAAWLLASPGGQVGASRSPINLFALFPGLKWLAKKPSFQSILVLPMLAVFYLVILAGLVGTKVSGRNAGPMVIWVLWLSVLIILLVPLGGRLWCLVCPLPSLGEWCQRRGLVRSEDEIHARPVRRLLGLPLIWPAWLRSQWPSLLFFIFLGTFSTALVALPFATSLLLIGLMFLALLSSAFPDARLFCRYLCPIKSYVSLYSMTGRLMARPVSGQTCAACVQHFCRFGSSKGWGCPYELCMGEVERNNDCGLCLECIKTCVYDNVALFWRRSGWDRTLVSYGEAWQAIVMFCLAILYCLVNLGHWHQIRDWVDIIDKQHWRSFAFFGLGVWVVCLGIVPLLWYALIKLGLVFSRLRLPAGPLFRAFSAALVPLGSACWISFAVALLLSMMTFVLQSLSDPFNWGWNLLGAAGSRWHILWAPAIPWIQVGCITLGLTGSLKTLYLGWQATGPGKRRLFWGILPSAAFLWTAAAGLICFFAA